MYSIKFRVNCSCECGCTNNEEVTVVVFETKEVMETLDYIEKNDCTFISCTEEDVYFGLDSFKEYAEEQSDIKECERKSDV